MSTLAGLTNIQVTVTGGRGPIGINVIGTPTNGQVLVKLASGPRDFAGASSLPSGSVIDAVTNDANFAPSGRAVTVAIGAVVSGAQAAANEAALQAGIATAQASNAQMASIMAGTFPIGAATNVPVGLPQAGVGAITGGSGGTNNTFALAWTGGNFLYNPVGTFTVAGGVVTAVNIQFPGLYLGTSPTAPTANFAASAGLTGASVVLTAKAFYGSGQSYWALDSGGTFYQHYTVNGSGVPVADAGMTSPANLTNLTAAVMTGRRIYLVRKQVLNGHADSNLIAVSATLLDGTQKNFATNLQAASSLVTGGFSVAISTRKLFLFRQQVTTGGTDSVGTVEYARTLGGRAFPYPGNIKTAPHNISCVGDSITYGIYGTPYPTQLAGVSSMVGRTVTNLGVSGQGSRQIAGRIGATAFGFTLSGNQISSGSNSVTAITGNALIAGAVLVGPATGTTVVGGIGTGREGNYTVFPSQTWTGTFTVAGDSPTTYTGSIAGNTLTVSSVAGVAIQGMATAGSLLFNQMLSTAPDLTTRTLTGYLGCVHGTLTRTASGGTPSTTETYTFTPDAGTTLPVYCAPGTVFQPDYVHRDDTHVFWLGRNGYTDLPRLLADIAACVAMLSHKRFLILSVLNGSGENKGTANWTTIFGINQSLAASYPNNFVDVRSYLIYEGLAALGLTATSQDLTDISNDVIPTQLRGDTQHPTGAANGLIANLIAQAITNKGF